MWYRKKAGECEGSLLSVEIEVSTEFQVALGFCVAMPLRWSPGGDAYSFKIPKGDF